MALIGAIALLFILFLGAALGPALSRGRKLLHTIGATAAACSALAPMFRAIALTLILILIIDTTWQRRAARARLLLAGALCVALLIAAGALSAPEALEERGSGDNLYARVAQLEQSIGVFLDHPILGIGFANFERYVTGEGRLRTTYEGIASVDTPHNNLTQALAETGILGFVPYVGMHLILFQAMREMRRVSRSGPLVWRYFVYVLLIYWITGMDESSGFEPGNVWYGFVLAVCYKYALTDRAVRRDAPAPRAPVSRRKGAPSRLSLYEPAI